MLNKPSAKKSAARFLAFLIIPLSESCLSLPLIGAAQFHELLLSSSCESKPSFCFLYLATRAARSSARLYAALRLALALTTLSLRATNFLNNIQPAATVPTATVVPTENLIRPLNHSLPTKTTSVILPFLLNKPPR